MKISQFLNKFFSDADTSKNKKKTQQSYGLPPQEQLFLSSLKGFTDSLLSKRVFTMFFFFI